MQDCWWYAFNVREVELLEKHCGKDWELVRKALLANRSANRAARLTNHKEIRGEARGGQQGNA